MINPRETEKRVEDNMSVYNPTDAAMMKQDGAMGSPGETTVLQALEKLGIDPQGPATQLVQWAKSQIKKAEPANKMRNIAGAQRMAQPPQEAPSLEGLMGE